MHISEINIYPVKSLKGISLTEAAVEKRGFRHDRRWMLTDKDGMFFTQREFPRMATIAVEVGNDCLRFSAPGAEDLRIPAEPAIGSNQQVTVWSSTCECAIYDDAVNDWFGQVLDTDCQLVYMPDETERHVSEIFDTGDDIVSFADGYPLLLIGENSLEDLNSRLDERVPMTRFRPSVVVTGPAAFDEDGWHRIKVGDATFRVAKPCARCVMTTVDQAEGEFTGKEPLKTLAAFRAARDIYPNTFESLGLTASSTLFGQGLIPETTGVTIRLGDPIEVIERKG
jgi:uncharacterized protein YcbX